MRSNPLVSLGLPALALALLSPGCALSDLKNTNRRLKEANDRLVSENNRLEQELAASEKEVAEKTRLLDQLQGGLDRPREAPEADAGVGKARASLIPDLREEGVSVTSTSQGILIRLDDRVFFAQGRATLAAKGKAILGRVASTINSRYRGHLIRVEGHTDDVPINKVKNLYPSNWELSTARACTVVRYLVDQGSVSPRRIYPAGFAYFKPVASARSESARQKNRRVEILILNEQA